MTTFTEMTFNDGQKKLLSAAKYLEKRWMSSPIRTADINDKRACDRLIWLVSEAGDPTENDTFLFEEGDSDFKLVKITFP